MNRRDGCWNDLDASVEWSTALYMREGVLCTGGSLLVKKGGGSWWMWMWMSRLEVVFELGWAGLAGAWVGGERRWARARTGHTLFCKGPMLGR